MLFNVFTSVSDQYHTPPDESVFDEIRGADLVSGTS